MAFLIVTVEKRLTVEDEELASLWSEWRATEERSGRERAAWERIVERAEVLAEVEESNIDFVVDVEEVDDSKDAEYEPPTMEEWHRIADVIESVTGWTAFVEGSGAGCTFIAVTLPDGRALAFGDNGDVWTADVYADLDALQSGENALSSVETDVPTKLTGGDLLNRYHDPESIAHGLKDACTDVCLAGNPAIIGKCGVPGCVCA